MKTILRLVALLVFSSLILVAQQKSDYVTVQLFRTTAQSISKNMDKANSVQECAELNASVDALEKKFADDKTLLNKAIFPDGYDRTIEHLRGKLLVRQKDLGFIESQVVRITELETTVRGLSDQVQKLNIQNEKLLADIQMLTQNVQKLTGDLFNAATPLDSLHNMIVKLRQGLQDRDALIFALTDSLFLQYDKNVSDMKDVEKQGLLGKIGRHNIVGNVKRSIMDNVTFLETTQFKGSDLVTLVRQQKRFQSQWTGIAPKLTSIYVSGKAKKYEVSTVDSMLAVWGDKVDDAMWRSLNTLFKEKGFFVKEFRNGEEFSANFITFLSEQIQNPNEETNDTRFKLFTNFHENLWLTDLNATWLPALTELNKISDTQRKEIEVKVEKWRSIVSPGASWLIYVLVLLGVLLIPILAIRLFPKAQKTPKETSST
jgi:outer membrane murein-binding lipoprotein Lpp